MDRFKQFTDAELYVLTETLSSLWSQNINREDWSVNIKQAYHDFLKELESESISRTYGSFGEFKFDIIKMNDLCKED